jgi:predicted DNA-binding protein (UPF0251 family)
MARPPSLRRVDLGFDTRVFKPAGIPTRDLKVVRLDLDGLEALRLADREGLYHEAAAEQMGVSRATFGRILSEARARVAETLTDGKALWIGGGPVIEGDGGKLPCPLHWGGRRRGRGCRCTGRWGRRRSTERNSTSEGQRPSEGEDDERNE